MRLKSLLLSLLISTGLSVNAQPGADILDYISAYKELAISEMQRTGVPASIKLAQGIHETMAGKSDLVLKSHNHFGIKCKSSWTGDKVYHDDDARGECFRSYASSLDSYKDHSDFLRNSERYSFLFNMDPTDYKAWAYGLKKAGYATNIKYSNILIKLIEDYNLQQYTLIAMGKLSPRDEIFAGRKLAGDEAVILTESATSVSEEEIPAAPKRDYPAGEFTINNTKVVFVPAGTSVLGVAEQYDISLSRLLDFNDLKGSEVLAKEQLLFLQRKRKTGANEFHTVQKGETLYDICQNEGIRLESLITLNQLGYYSDPAPGEKLYLKSHAPSKPRLLSNTSK